MINPEFYTACNLYLEKSLKDLDALMAASDFEPHEKIEMLYTFYDHYNQLLDKIESYVESIKSEMN